MTKKFQPVPFIFGKDFIKSLSENSDYSTRTAINELIDNALAANATEINCSIYEDELGKTVFKITDNGDGMSPIDFTTKFMVFGDSTNKNNEKASSYFGIGGKAGLIFLTKDSGSIEIITHKSENLTCNAILKKYSLPKICEYNDDAKPFGTTIIIKDCRLDADYDAGRLINTIGVDYYPMLSKRKDVVIRMNGNKVKPIDPLYRNALSEKHYIFEKAVIGGMECPITFVSFNNDILKKEHINEYDKMLCRGKKGGALSTTATSGLYIVYGGRYIAFGGNIKLLGLEKHTSFNGNRVEIILTKEMASLLKVKWNKSGLSLTLKENEYAADLLRILIDLFRKHVKSQMKINDGLKNKWFDNIKKNLKDCSVNEYHFDLNVNEDELPDLPVLTYTVEYGKGKTNKKRNGVFSINVKSRKYPKNDSGVKKFIKEVSTEIPLLTHVACLVTEEEMSTVIQKRFQ